MKNLSLKAKLLQKNAAGMREGKWHLCGRDKSKPGTRASVNCTRKSRVLKPDQASS